MVWCVSYFVFGISYNFSNDDAGVHIDHILDLVGIESFMSRKQKYRRDASGRG